MKLHINPRELLALNNLLHAASHKPNGPDAQVLEQLHNRVRACIISSLAERARDPFELWEAGQRAKIDELREGVAAVKREQRDLASAGQAPPAVMPADGFDEAADSYPRRSSSKKQHRNG